MTSPEDPAQREDDASRRAAADLLAHAGNLRHLARSLIRDPHAADDLEQDAWVELLEGRARPAAARETTSWLGGLLRNLVRERSRGDGRRAHREGLASRPESVVGEQGLVERLETFRMLAAEVADLEEPYRSSLFQRFFEGRTADEIAAREGVAAATVRARWMRALSKLRERLDQRHGGDRRQWFASLALVSLPERSLPPAATRTALIAGAAILCTGAVVWSVSTPSARDDLAATTSAEFASSASGAGVDWDRAPERVARTSALPVADATSAGTTTPVMAGAKAPLALRLVDLWSGEGIPWCWARVTAPNDVRVLRSDREGRLHCDAIALGEIGVEVLDDRDAPPGPIAGEARAFRRARPVQHVDGEELSLVVPVGPTFLLDLDLPAGFVAEDLRASMSGGVVLGPRSNAIARVRDPHADAASEPWVRFGPDARALAGGGPWTLRIASSDGTCAGEALIDGPLSAGTQRATIRMTRRCVLELRLTGATGNPIEAQVVLRRPGGEIVVASATTGPTWIASTLEPGELTLEAHALGLPVLLAEVEVVEPTTRIALAFAPAAPGGAISGFVEDAPMRAAIDLVLRDDRGGERRVAAAEVSERGAPRAFRFDSVPAGTYELRAESALVADIEPEFVRVEPPAESVRLRARAPANGRPLIVKARDAHTGAPIEHFDALIAVAADRARRRGTSIGSVVFPGLAPDEPVEWRIAAPGWVSARGSERDLRIEVDRISLDVVLERGVGLLVHAVNGATGAAIAGVRVSADGVLRGSTDSRGELVLRMDAPPKRLEGALTGWRIVGGDVDPRSGAWTTRAFDRIEMRFAALDAADRDG